MRIHLPWVNDSPLGCQGQRVPPNPSFQGPPHPQAVCCTREGSGRGRVRGDRLGAGGRETETVPGNSLAGQGAPGA